MTERPDMDLPDGGKSYKLVAEGAESTVVAEYEPSHGRETAYQSEADLEEELLRILESQGYERLSAHTESELIANLRTQLEKLNDVRFTDNEWSHFFHEVIASSTAGIEDKTRLIQEDNIQILNRDDGTTKNIRLIDKVHVHSNRLQVLHQFEEEGGSHPTRYDVTILVNGLPLVQIELKRRGVAIKEAFNQINRYQRDSFGPDRDSMSTPRSSSSRTARIPSTTATPRASSTSMKWKAVPQPAVRRRAPTASNSPAGGPTDATMSSPT